MRKRVIGIIVAAVLGTVGTLLIVAYLDDAEERSSAGDEVADVLVADAFVPAGTPVEQLGGVVSVRTVPVDLVLEGAVTDLAQLDGLVVADDLEVNEPLSVSGFAEADEVRGTVEVPDGFVEVSFNISPDRSIGGAIRPGDTISIIAAFDAGEQPANSVTAMLRDVLVTAVQGDQPVTLDAEAIEAGQEISPVPINNSLITVALGGADASRLVYAVEYGRLYLALEPSDEAAVLERVITAENVLAG